jgi:hypothetical protein
MASAVFSNGIIRAFNNSSDFTSTLKAILISSSGGGTGRLQFDTHDFLDDIEASWRMVATIQKWKDLTATLVMANGKVQFGSGSESFSFTNVRATAGGAKGVLLFLSAATEGASTLWAYNEFSSAVAGGGVVTVTLNASGSFLGSN